MSKLIVCVGLLACLSLAAAPANGKGYHQSGVIGQVQSDIVFNDWTVLVVSDDGEFVTEFLTDENGGFAVDLKPGTYALVAFIPVVGPFPPIVGTPVTVTVEKKQFESVILPVIDVVPVPVPPPPP